MPKISTCPTLIDEATCLNIASLKKWGYLKPGIIHIGNLNWSRSGQKTASVSIQINTTGEPWVLFISYNYQGSPVQLYVRIALIPSNLGKGKVPYFICPVTFKHCRKLFLFNGKFVHREAIRGALYECQTYSKRNRGLFGAMKREFGFDEAYETIKKKWFKKNYNNKPTKRFIKASRFIGLK